MIKKKKIAVKKKTTLEEKVSHTILVVNDDRQVLDSLRMDLEFNGYLVIPYDDSWEASRAIEDGLEYNVAIFDLELTGGIDGEQLTTTSKEKNPKTPVIIFSGYSLKYSKHTKADTSLVYTGLTDDLHSVLEKYLK